MEAEKSALENGAQNGGNGTTAPPIFTSPPTSPRSVRTAPPVRHRTRRARRRQTHDVEAQNAALQRRRSNATGSSSSSSSTEDELEDMEAAFKNIIPTKEGLTRFYSRFTRRGKKKIGIWESAKNMVMSSWLNLFVIFIPLAWVSHWHWADPVTFVLCFLALVPLEWLFDWGGEQLAHYCGKNLGDLVIITLNNSIEATLAIVLLNKCKLRLMQSTVVGVVILHLLLIPGVAFVTGGARIMHQELHAHSTELNHSLLTVGVLSLLLPAAFFAALDNGATKQLTASPVTYISESYVTDETRSVFLRMSRGMAVILLVIYISSRVYLHNPPGDGNALELDEHAPEALKHEEKELEEKDPKANQYFLIAVLAVAIGIMAATTEWLVESIEFVAEDPNLKEEWFGMILLPIVSFAANGFVAVVYFFRYLFRQWFKSKPEPPAELARARAIDLSIQFTLFWMPFFILLAWWIDRPLSLLFDFFEIAVLLGACFLVNYVTADSKTNWAEGIIMVAFYVMIALCAWFYDGQPDIKVLAGPEGCSNSTGGVPSVADTIRFWNETLHAAESGGVVEHAAEGAKELLKRLVGYD